jgi:hypothetical protein
MNRYLQAWAKRRRQPRQTGRERAARAELDELLQEAADKKRMAAVRRAEDARARARGEEESR